MKKVKCLEEKEPQPWPLGCFFVGHGHGAEAPPQVWAPKVGQRLLEDIDGASMDPVDKGRQMAGVIVCGRDRPASRRFFLDRSPFVWRF